MTKKITGSLSSSTFIKILKTFNKKELNEFEKFISSSFFNNQSPLVRLFKEIKKSYPEYESDKLDKELLFKKINPGKKYSDLLIRKYISNLTKLSEEYLIYEDIRNNADRRRTCLLDQFDRRGLYSLFEKLSVLTEKIDMCETIDNESFYYRNFREELKANFNIRTNDLMKLNTNLKKAHKYSLLYLLLSNTVYSNMMLVTKKSFNDVDIENTFEKFFEIFDLTKYIESQNNLTKSEIMFVRLCKFDILLVKDPYDDQNLKEMNTVLKKLTSYLNNNLLYTFFSHLNIFYLLNISAGKDELLRDLFENYKFMIGKGLYINEGRGYISFPEYRSILLYALRLKEFEWAEDYIIKHKKYHNEDMQNNLLNYSLAYLNFEKGNFDESLKFISKVEIENIIIRLDTEVIYMLLYYEKKYYDSALSLAETVQHSLKNNVLLSKDVVNNQLIFTKYYKMLVKCVSSNNYQDTIDFLFKEVTNSKQFRRKDWILSKIKKIMEETLVAH